MSTSTFNFPLGCLVFMYLGKPGNRHSTKLLLLNKKEMTVFQCSRHGEITGNLSTIDRWAHSTRTEAFYWYAIKNGAQITAVVLPAKARNFPLIQGGPEIPVSIKVEWEDKINLERLKAKVSSLAYSLKDAYVDKSKEILDKILKGNHCEVPSDNDEVVECFKTGKETEVVV